MEEYIPILEGLVRLGIVSDTDSTHRKVRVLDQTAEITTGWLYVLNRGDGWMPEVNDQVLVLFLPMDNSDGFVLGGI